MSSIAVITARGGSKRIPHKNIRDFHGRPIIAYSIDAALSSGVFDEVMVSTDDAQIAEIARSLGASVPFLRSEKTSDDFATTADVILEVMDGYETLGKSFDVWCCIYPTAPFVTAGKLREAASLLGKDCDSVLSCTAFSFPPQRGLVLRDGHAKWWMPEYASKRSQDIETIYHDAGQFYFFWQSTMRELHSVIGEQARPFVVPETEVQDIDNLSDWVIAEMKYERMVSHV